MASNKAATVTFMAAFAMIFTIEVALAQHTESGLHVQDMRKLLHFHYLPRDAIRNPHGGVSVHHHHHHYRHSQHHHSKPPCANSAPHFKWNGFDFTMEKGHETCYIACYKNVFISESSPFTAEGRCHDRCSSKRVSSRLSSTTNAKPKISSTNTATAKPTISSTTTEKTYYGKPYA